MKGIIIPPYLPVRAISRSQRVRIGGINLSKEVSPGGGLPTVYVDLNPSATNNLPKAYTALKELKQHLAIGAVIPVGGITNSNSDWVVDSGGVVTAEANAAKAEAELAVSENQDRRRSTGVWVTSEALTKVKIKLAEAGKERIDLIYAIVEGAEAGKVKKEEGTAAATGKAVVKATPAKSIPIAEVKRIAEEAVTIKDVRPRP